MQDGISASFLFATAQGRITTSISSRGNYQHIKGNVVRFKKKKKNTKFPPEMQTILWGASVPQWRSFAP